MSPKTKTEMASYEGTTKAIFFTKISRTKYLPPISHQKALFRECDTDAAPGGQSGDIPKGLCL